MIELKKFESKISRYKELKRQLPDMEESVRNLEGHCTRAIRGQWGLCRMNKHGKVADQVREVLRNNHTPEEIKAPLIQLNPLLAKALDDLRETKSQASKIWRELSESGDSLLSQAQSEISRIQDQIFSKLVGMLRPFTNDHDARSLAKQTDAFKSLEFISSNLLHNLDPEVCLNLIKSALDSAKKYQALLK